MKCSYEKAIHEQWLKTKFTCEGVKGTIDLIYNHYKKEYDKLPADKKKDAGIDVKDFLKYLKEAKKQLIKEFGGTE